MSTVISRTRNADGTSTLRTAGEYTPSGTKYPRGQKFQMLSSLPGMGEYEPFTQTMGYFLHVRNLRDAVAEKEATLRKQGNLSEQGIKREVTAFAKSLRPKLKELKEADARRRAPLMKAPEAPKAPEVPSDQIGLRITWWATLTADAKRKVVEAAMNGGDQEFAAVLHAAPWAFGLSEVNHGLIKNRLGIAPPAPSEQVVRTVEASEELEAEITEFERDIDAADPDYKPPQVKRGEMSTHEKHAYLVQHGSKAYMELPE